MYVDRRLSRQSPEVVLNLTRTEQFVLSNSKKATLRITAGLQWKPERIFFLIVVKSKPTNQYFGNGLTWSTFYSNNKT